MIEDLLISAAGAFGGTLGFAGKVHNIYKGDCVFVPADSVEICLHGQLQLLDIRG